jgi:hypothetical protein
LEFESHLFFHCMAYREKKEFLSYDRDIAISSRLNLRKRAPPLDSDRMPRPGLRMRREKSRQNLVETKPAKFLPQRPECERSPFVGAPVIHQTHRFIPLMAPHERARKASLDDISRGLTAFSGPEPMMSLAHYLELIERRP